MFQNHLRYFEYHSKLLQGYPLSGGDKRVIATLLPEDFDEKQAYPCIWFLGGFGSNGREMLNDQGPFKSSFAQMLHSYQRQRIIPQFIAVFPDGCSKLGGSQYINSAANGPFMDHLCDELVPFIESKLPTLSSSRGRVITGHSSGGYGALMVSLLRPGVFGSAIVSAADSAFECTFLPMWLQASIQLQKHNGVDGFLEHFQQMKDKGKISSDLFHTNMLLAMSACYSPKLNNHSAHCELPIDLHSLQVNEEIWTLWMNLDPVIAVKAHSKNLKSMDYLHLDCGKADEYGAQFGHRRISDVLKQNDVKHMTSEFNGTHRSTSYRYQQRFEQFGQFVDSVKLF